MGLGEVASGWDKIVGRLGSGRGVVFSFSKTVRQDAHFLNAINIREDRRDGRCDRVVCHEYGCNEGREEARGGGEQLGSRGGMDDCNGLEEQGSEGVGGAKSNGRRSDWGFRGG